MERRKLSGKDIGLGVEDVLWSVVHVHVPHLDQTVWVVWSGGVLGIRSKDKLWEL